MALENGNAFATEAIQSFVPNRVRRQWAIMRFQRAHQAHRDARLVFRAAAEGRPLELQRRLVLGKLAGGGHATRQHPRVGRSMNAMEAASLGGHS